jgi:hypothetical protein
MKSPSQSLASFFTPRLHLAASEFTQAKAKESVRKLLDETFHLSISFTFHLLCNLDNNQHIPHEALPGSGEHAATAKAYLWTSYIVLGIS